MFTECGELRRGSDVEKALNAWFEETNFQTAEGDPVRRSWTSWTRRTGPQGDRPRHDWEESFAVPPRGRRTVRPAAVARGRRDQPGGHGRGRGAGARAGPG